jgi:hypothetical protein
LIGPGAGSAEVKFLAKPPEISEVKICSILLWSHTADRRATCAAFYCGTSPTAKITNG